MVFIFNLGMKKKPKRTSIPKQVSAKDINLEKALAFLSLPRLIGQHPESGQDISAGIGRYGPYLKYDINFISLPADETVINLGLNHAVVLIAENSEKLGKVLGDHPDGGGKIFVKSGRFGPYVEHNKLRATLPKDISIEEINLDKAIELLIAKATRPKRSSKKTNKSKKTK
jgi:DNA topoisomerase-1